MPPRGSGGGTGGTGGGSGAGRRIVAGSIVYKFEIVPDPALQAQLQAHVEHAEKLIKQMKDLNTQYAKAREEGEGGFKALNLAVAGFFALLVANSSTTRDMFGAVFASMGTVMDSIALIFLPLVTKLQTLFTDLARAIYDVTSGTQGMEGAFEGLGQIIGKTLAAAIPFAISFTFDVLTTGIPAIHNGVEEALRGLDDYPGLKSLATMAIDTAAFGAMIKMGGGLASKMGMGKGVSWKSAALGGLALHEWGELNDAWDGDLASIMGLGMGAVGAGTGLAKGGGTSLGRGGWAMLGGVAGQTMGNSIGGHIWGTETENAPTTAEGVFPPGVTPPTGYNDIAAPTQLTGGDLSGAPIVENVNAQAEVTVNQHTTYNVATNMNMNVNAGEAGSVVNMQVESSGATGPGS